MCLLRPGCPPTEGRGTAASGRLAGGARAPGGYRPAVSGDFRGQGSRRAAPRACRGRCVPTIGDAGHVVAPYLRQAVGGSPDRAEERPQRFEACSAVHLLAGEVAGHVRPALHQAVLHHGGRARRPASGTPEGVVAHTITGWGRLGELRERAQSLGSPVAGVELFGGDDQDVSVRGAAAERWFAPFRVLGAGISNFVVPIRHGFATALFDAGLSQGQLFDREWHLGLRRELVYYRSPHAAPRGLAPPARLLWYVSGATSSARRLPAAGVRRRQVEAHSLAIPSGCQRTCVRVRVADGNCPGWLNTRKRASPWSA